MVKTKSSKQQSELPLCFVIMPFSDPDGYRVGHFSAVYKNVVEPAIQLANFKADRADLNRSSNLIQLELLKCLLEAPMAVCDLSSRNPNVLFELGLRQAFDKPVVLIQEKGTPRIFDIIGLRCLEYSKDMRYDEVLQTHEDLSASITATFAAHEKKDDVNSIVKLLALSKATLPDVSGNTQQFSIDVLMSEMQRIRNMLENYSSDTRASGSGAFHNVRVDFVPRLHLPHVKEIEKFCSSSRIHIRNKIHSKEGVAGMIFKYSTVAQYESLIAFLKLSDIGFEIDVTK